MFQNSRSLVPSQRESGPPRSFTQSANQASEVQDYERYKRSLWLLPGLRIAHRRPPRNCGRRPDAQMVEARHELWGHRTETECPEDQTTEGSGMESANRGIHNPTSIQQQQEFQVIPNKLIEAVVIFVFMAAAAGHLPKLIKTVQIAQYQVLKASQSSKWGRAMLLPVRD